MGADTFDFVVS